MQYDQEAVRIQLGDTLLMDKGQPLPFDAKAASAYLKGKADVHGTVDIQVGPVAGPAVTLPWPAWPLLTRVPWELDGREGCAGGADKAHRPPQVTIGDGPGRGMAWGCDLSYDYVKVKQCLQQPPVNANPLLRRILGLTPVVMLPFGCAHGVSAACRSTQVRAGCLRSMAA